MKPYCETVAQLLIPTMRALIARELMEKYNLTQQGAAKKLGITQAAISQYRRELRGSKISGIEKDKIITKKIEVFAGKMASGDLNVLSAMEEFCGICKAIRKSKLICNVHKEIFPELKDCKICL